MDVKAKNEKLSQRVLKASEVAEILSISKALAYKLMQTGKIRTIHIAGARRVRRKDLEDYIDSNLQPPLAY